MKNLEKFLDVAYPALKLLIMLFPVWMNIWTISPIILFLFMLATFCTDLIVRAIENPKK